MFIIWLDSLLTRSIVLSLTHPYFVYTRFQLSICRIALTKTSWFFSRYIWWAPQSDKTPLMACLSAITSSYWRNISKNLLTDLKKKTAKHILKNKKKREKRGVTGLHLWTRWWKGWIKVQLNINPWYWKSRLWNCY